MSADENALAFEHTQNTVQSGARNRQFLTKFYHSRQFAIWPELAGHTNQRGVNDFFFANMVQAGRVTFPD